METQDLARSYTNFEEGPATPSQAKPRAPQLLRTYIASPEFSNREGLLRCLSKPEGFDTEVTVNLKHLDFTLPCVLIVDHHQLASLPQLPSHCRTLLAAHESWQVSELALLVGCHGVIDPNCADPVLRKAIRAVATGELWAGRKTVASVIFTLRRMQKIHRLTPREQEILSLLGLGRKNREISDRLHISLETVRWHLRALYSKIGVEDRQSAIDFAERWRNAVLDLSVFGQLPCEPAPSDRHASG